MRLIYTATGKEVQIGDMTPHGKVVGMPKPHKPESEGKIYVKKTQRAMEEQYYVSVIGAEWIEREDRLD